MLFCIDKCNHHSTQTHQDPRYVACHKQGGNRHAACYCGIHDKCTGWRNQKSGRRRSNVDCCSKCRVITLFLLNRVNTTAHGRTCCNCRTGQSAEQHVSKNVCLCQRTRNPAAEQLRKVYQSSGNTAVVHNITGQDKQRHCKKRETLHTAVHFLHGNESNLIPGQCRHCRYNRRNYNSYRNRTADKQQDSENCK